MINLVPHVSLPVTKPCTPSLLDHENQRFGGTGGVSSHNRKAGFRPAFLDRATGRIFPSRFANGTLAPLHLLDGLPEELVLQRDAKGTIIAVKETVFAGFVRGTQFYTREEAAIAVMMG